MYGATRVESMCALCVLSFSCCPFVVAASRASDWSLCPEQVLAESDPCFDAWTGIDCVIGAPSHVV